ncbi:MAG: hypothetical protein J6A08_05545 [Lachnospiraceae bacterium]|nr:hypothetical protein [Lachnospiraceae bacterium]
MKQKIMAVCDTEEAYAYRLAEYVLEKGKLPYAFHLFTEVEKLQDLMEREEIAILLIAESALKLIKEEFVRQKVLQLFVLQENEKSDREDLCYISKYQSPDHILERIFISVEDLADWTEHQSTTCWEAKLIGMYSPIKRCLQTSFALTLGQMLARKHKVLYLNFEYYSGLGQMLSREFSADMMDVMYYFQCAKEKLAMRLPAVVQNINGLDYIPPIQSPLGLREIDGGQWAQLCADIAEIGQYEYIILDLDDCINGIFDLLKQCYRIYTITKEDRFAEAKLRQYEQMLQLYEMEEVAEKTVKCRFPVFQKLPSDLEMMTHGELAGYVRSIMEEDIYGK